MAGQAATRRVRKTRMTRKVCRVCGREFWSAGDGDICVKPSTCRVKEHQMRRAAAILAQERVLDMDYFMSFHRVIALRPTLQSSLEQFVTAHGIPAAKANLAMLERMLAGEI